MLLLRVIKHLNKLHYNQGPVQLIDSSISATMTFSSSLVFVNLEAHMFHGIKKLQISVIPPQNLVG